MPCLRVVKINGCTLLPNILLECQIIWDPHDKFIEPTYSFFSIYNLFSTNLSKTRCSYFIFVSGRPLVSSVILKFGKPFIKDALRRFSFLFSPNPGSGIINPLLNFSNVSCNDLNKPDQWHRSNAIPVSRRFKNDCSSSFKAL